MWYECQRFSGSYWGLYNSSSRPVCISFGRLFLTPGILAEIAANPFSIIWILLFWTVTLAPFFLLSAAVALLIRPLSPETRGILGFIIVIGGVVSTIILFFLVALSSS